MMGRASKGSRYERELCKRLSEWWTGGDRDDVFWRSSQSGGRATQRRKKGKDTAGNEGDIAVEHPCGVPLLQYTTIEIKRGYSKHTIADLLDKPAHAALQPFEKFLSQAFAAQSNAQSHAFWLIVRRDRREAILYMDCYEALELCPFFVQFGISNHLVVNVVVGDLHRRILCCQFEDFLENVSPKKIQDRLKELERKKKR